MELNGIPVFTWPINWASTVNGQWQFDLRELSLGFGPELTDIQQDYIIHGWEFQSEFRNSEIDDINAFLDALQGRSKPFWMPGPAAKFKVTAGDSATTFIIQEQGAESSWELEPGAYAYFQKFGESAQIAKITSVVDNGDGTETVTIEQIADESSSSGNSESSSSGSSPSSLNSSSSGHTSSSSESSSSGDVKSSSSSSEWIDIDEDWQVFPLYLVRLADDTERVEIVSEGYQRRSFKVIEVPHDYTAETVEPEAPIYLYRFLADLPDGQVVWRFTSHPTDVTLESGGNFSSSSSSSSLPTDSSGSSSSFSTPSSSSSSSLSSSSSPANQTSSSSSSSSSKSVSSSSSSESSSSTQSSSSSSSSAESSSSSSGANETWLAVPIEHDRLSRSTKLGGTVNVTGDYDSVEPLRLCIPMRLPVPLRFELLKTSTALDEPELLFSGTVLSPELLGRKVKVNCVEWSTAMDRRLPSFYIQRTCNYRVYDQSTCRASKADKQVSVTATGATGRLITIQSAALTGIVENWFAEGWLEIGSGLNRKTLFVSGNFAASGNQMVIVVNDPLTLELPLSAVIVPGCDGRRSTCIAKFDNLVNFGGHETPRSNLTLAAIRVQQGTGGKK